MTHSLLCSTQFSCLLSINTMDSEAVSVENSEDSLEARPADLDLHCFLKGINPGSA